MSEIVIETASSEETDPFFRDEWRSYDDRAGVHWDGVEYRLAARLGTELVGAAYYAVAGGVGELKQILVRGERSRCGIGSRLLREFERHCRELGCHKLRLETAEYQARGFYEKHGFTAVHRFANDRFHKTWHLMDKHISSDDLSGSKPCSK